MSKFHINPETGVVTHCRAASTDSCPFSGEDKQSNHFGSIREAREGYENVMKGKTLPEVAEKGPTAPTTTSRTTPKKKYNKSDVTPYLAGNPVLAKANQAFLDQEAEWKQLDKNVKNRRLSDDGFRNSPEEYSEVQRRKTAYYAMLKRQQELNEVLPKSVLNARNWIVKKKAEAKAKSLEAWKKKQDEKNGPYNFHPEITKKNEHQARNILTAWSGLSADEVNSRVADHESNGLSKTEAYREVFKELPLRTDKPIVAIDLEVAAPKVDGKVDTGSYSSIIEVGYVKRAPDGSTEVKEYLSGVPDDLMAVEGTGAEDIHNISPEMVEGLKPFVEDHARQKELMEDLDGSVMIAHNATYETSQFRANLPGFSKAVEEGRVEILDTRYVAQYFMPDTPSNNNESFVEGTGGTYEGAHRAGSDAVMTVNSLFRLKNLKEPVKS